MFTYSCPHKDRRDRGYSPEDPFSGLFPIDLRSNVTFYRIQWEFFFAQFVVRPREIITHRGTVRVGGINAFAMHEPGVVRLDGGKC